MVRLFAKRHQFDNSLRIVFGSICLDCKTPDICLKSSSGIPFSNPPAFPMKRVGSKKYKLNLSIFGVKSQPKEKPKVKNTNFPPALDEHQD